jgi:hypothetical protein
VTGDRRIVTAAEAAVIASVSRRTIYTWVQRGLVETCHQATRGAPCIFADSLLVVPVEGSLWRGPRP